MRNPEDELISIMKSVGVDYVLSLPCDRIKNLLLKIPSEFVNIPLTREEEGVGISAGAALAGKRPAMIIQNSGIGNMLNALLSLTSFYELPLAIFISHRGIYKEKIAAQKPMGNAVKGLLKASGVGYTVVDKREDLARIKRPLEMVYEKNRIHAFLLSPRVWEVECANKWNPEDEKRNPVASRIRTDTGRHILAPEYTRYEILEIISPYLDGKLVVCNIGIPSKELFSIKHQPSSFYMLGSMGMATPIGLGVALSSDRKVVVIDGDGSLLMNPGTLATAAHLAPGNLTIIVIDNGAYGSTGSQPTFTGSCVDLEIVARGFGIKNTVKVAGKKQLTDAVKRPVRGLTFIHVLALPGNADVPNISLHHLENKAEVQEFLNPHHT